jgi:hypothetical protein
VAADKRAVATAMEAASVLPDFKFREEDPSTVQWHFIDICLQNPRADIARRCPGGNCVTGKIDEYSKRLKEGRYDRWSSAGDLAFLIHFVGDIHQPLHTANDADRGGNCVNVASPPRVKDLHFAWDNTVVSRLEYRIDSGRPETTARGLEQTYAAEKSTDEWIAPNDIALESNQIARSDIYEALKLPVERCGSREFLCSHRPEVDLDPAYLNHAAEIAGHQLARAGFRLASLLNGIWPQPVAPGDVLGTPHGAAPPVFSSGAAAGQIVGNRQSKIYAWPGCGSYNTMAPQNRMLFPSRAAAEQAGYRAAYNCP